MIWPLAIVPLFPLHSALHHVFMNLTAPFYQEFNAFTKHTWVGRATSLATQAVVIPAYFMGNMTVFHHTLGAYIAADMMHMMMYARRDWMNWIHHITTFTSYIVSFGLPESMNATMLYGAFLLELTGPFVHLAWFANKAGYATAWWFRYLAGTTIGVYFAVRCMMFPFFVFTQVPYALWSLAVPFVLMNYAWFVELVRYANAVLTNAGASRLV